MSDMQIEAMIASPPERDELVVQLFVKDGGQWGEIYRKNDEYVIDIYVTASMCVCTSVENLIQTLVHSRQKLRDRLEAS